MNIEENQNTLEATQENIEAPIADETPKIEKGVPLPEERNYTKRFFNIVKDMEVGDSVVVPVNESVSLRMAGYRQGFKMTFRRISETEFRAWRTK